MNALNWGRPHLTSAIDLSDGAKVWAVRAWTRKGMMRGVRRRESRDGRDLWLAYGYRDSIGRTLISVIAGAVLGLAVSLIAMAMLS